MRMLSCVHLFGTLWTVAHQVRLTFGFPRQEYWSGLPLSPPGDLSDPVLNLSLLHLLPWRQILYPMNHQISMPLLQRHSIQPFPNIIFIKTNLVVPAHWISLWGLPVCDFWHSNLMELFKNFLAWVFIIPCLSVFEVCIFHLHILPS